MSRPTTFNIARVRHVAFLLEELQLEADVKVTVTDDDIISTQAHTASLFFL